MTQVALQHKFSTVAERGKRRTMIGEKLVTVTFTADRAIAVNHSGNEMVNCSRSLWDKLIELGYVHEPTDPWNN